MADAVVWALLALAVASAAVSALGVLLMPGVYDRLQYMGPVASVGALAVAAAILVQESLSPASVKAFLAALVILVMNPVLTHATARAARVRQYGRWEARPEDEVEGLDGGGA